MNTPEFAKNKQIIVVLTNASALHGRSNVSNLEIADANRTGYDIRAVAYIWEILIRRHNLSVIFTSPKGGPVQIDPRSIELTQDDKIVRQFMEDRSLMDTFKNTVKIDELLKKVTTTSTTNSSSEEYCAILLVGNHGALIDFPESSALPKIATCIYQHGGYICTIGHGICGLLKAKRSEASSASFLSRASDILSGNSASAGEYFLKGKRVACPTREEEEKLKIKERLPFILQEKCEELGCKLELKDPFVPNVVKDERLITAQNSESTHHWIMEILNEWNLKK